jgi:hypothetical protein
MSVRPATKDLDGPGPASPRDLSQLHLFKDVADDVLGDVFSVLKSNHYNNRATILLDRDFQDRVGFIWSGPTP